MYEYLQPSSHLTVKTQARVTRLAVLTKRLWAKSACGHRMSNCGPSIQATILLPIPAAHAHATAMKARNHTTSIRGRRWRPACRPNTPRQARRRRRCLRGDGARDGGGRGATPTAPVAWGRRGARFRSKKPPVAQKSARPPRPTRAATSASQSAPWWARAAPPCSAGADAPPPPPTPPARRLPRARGGAGGAGG